MDITNFNDQRREAPTEEILREAQNYINLNFKGSYRITVKKVQKPFNKIDNVYLDMIIYSAEKANKLPPNTFADNMDNRAPIFVDGRMMCYKWLKIKGYSLQFIGCLFDKDHSTVINGIKNHDAYMINNVAYREKYNEFTNILNNHE